MTIMRSERGKNGVYLAMPLRPQGVSRAEKVYILAKYGVITGDMDLYMGLIGNNKIIQSSRATYVLEHDNPS